MKDGDFIAQMVQETIDSQQTSNVLKFKNPDDTETFDVHFDQSKKCYTLKTPSKTLEIPMNWGPFKNRIASEFTLSIDEDDDKFINVLSTFLEKPLYSIKIKFLNSPNSIGQKNISDAA